MIYINGHVRLAPLSMLALVMLVAHAQEPNHAPHAQLTGTLSGVITDAISNRPVAHALVTVGYLSAGFQRATETDARGQYIVTGLPATSRGGIDTYAFAQGYFYHHGVNQVIRAGHTTVYSYAIPRDTFAVKHPRILSYSAATLGRRRVKFSMTAIDGTGPFSFEMMAISPQLGYLVVLEHGPGHHYDGTLIVPRDVKRGAYRFYYIATQQDCYTNPTFPFKDVMLG